SHDLSVVAGLADRIAVMYAGEIVETGPTTRVFDHPRHPYTLGLLACIPRLDTPRTETLRSIEGGLPDPHARKSGCPFVPRCAFAMDRCAVDPPALVEKAPAQSAACWADLSEVTVTEVAAPAATSPAAWHSNGQALVSVTDLKVHFPFGAAIPFRRRPLLRAVDGVSVDVPRGGTLGIVGESGCGKSTTGRALLRLVEPTSGQIRFEGHDVAHIGPDELKPRRRGMQMVSQDPYSSLNPRLSVGDAVGEPLVVHHAAPHGGLRPRVVELLEMVGLPARLARRYPHQ